MQRMRLVVLHDHEPLTFKSDLPDKGAYLARQEGGGSWRPLVVLPHAVRHPHTEGVVGVFLDTNTYADPASLELRPMTPELTFRAVPETVLP